jgi:FtsP/CotA-like multicopper oxidase with cupredoxin domain
LKVKQGAELAITEANETDLPTTVHWHGIRLDNRRVVEQGIRTAGIQ